MKRLIILLVPVSLVSISINMRTMLISDDKSNDSLFNYQYALLNTLQPDYDIDATYAWDYRRAFESEHAGRCLLFL